jgi:peptidoglycan-associated lipoprotein
MMKLQYFGGVALIGLCLGFGGCAKKVIAKNPPAPTPAATTAAAAPANYTRPSSESPSRAATQATAKSGMPDAATRQRIQELLDRIQDVYFDYDKKTLRPDALVSLKDDSKALSDIIRQYPDFHLVVEGYCDERGSSEYNLALGEARARQAQEYLVTLGLPANQLKTVSYGKERPVCTDETETCWQKNRRAHITQSS